ncbi:MAG: hydroxyisourate hydrolase [Rubritepida sp.]|nr:hydroxyisourate hydrolase [Rubritepida sp.]
MGLSMHVLDTARGCPGAGMRYRLYWLDGGGRALLRDGLTGADGRATSPLLAQDELRVGPYELLFAVAGYFRAAGLVLSDPPFIDEVCLRFNVSDPAAHYHIPLICSPYGYTTYRGS